MRIKNRNIFISYFFAIQGILFFIIILFPFWHRNESIEWAAILPDAPFFAVLTEQIVSLSFRPVAQLIAWGSINLFGISPIPVQLLNFFIFLSSLFFFVKYSVNRALTSLVILLLTTLFFSVFYYNFHLHGIFYSPILLLISLSTIPNINYKVFFAFGIVISLLHPLGFLILLSFLINKFIFSNGVLHSKIQILLLSIFALILFTIYFLPSIEIDLAVYIYNLITAFNSAELNGLLKPISLLIAFSILFNSRNDFYSFPKYYIAVFSIVIVYTFSFPGLLILIAFSLYTAYNEKDFISIGNIFVSTLFVMYVESGAATKTAPLLFSLVPVLSRKNLTLALLEKYINRFSATSFSISIITLAILIRLNINIPVVSNLVSPFKIEKEKTVQLKEILNWYQNSTYIAYNLKLEKDPVNKAGLNINTDRKTIPPTFQNYLDSYLNQSSKKNKTNTQNKELIISFGIKEPLNEIILYKNYQPTAQWAVVKLNN